MYFYDSDRLSLQDHGRRKNNNFELSLILDQTRN